ncbi:glycosyltransferase family 39 protein [Dapis sp. BLCC M126]|uniref:glycosyltransferase family 39 protein n=1 Tax=Dapis sp. BLCC M126 TaxID=3400189 RepID=UPI003CF885BC
MKVAQQNSIRIDFLKRWLPIALILLLATVLRLYQLGTEGLWLDEMFSIGSAQNDDTSFGNSRVVYFFLLGFWMKFGTSDSWLRGLAVIFGITSVFLIYKLALQISEKPVALIAALIMALSPLFIWHSQEIRYYTLSTFITIAGSLALIYALENPKNFSLGCWSIARLLAILTTPLNITLLLPDSIIFGWKFRQQKRWLIVFGTGLLFICISWLPTAFDLATVFGPQFMDGWAKELPKPDIRHIIARLIGFTVFWPPSVFESKDVNAIVLSYYKLITLVLIYLLGVALFIAFKKRYHSPKLIWVMAWAFLPAASILFISYIKSNIWIDRYLIFVSPYIFILLAEGFMQIWHWQRQIAIVLAISYLVAVGGGLGNYYTTLYRDDWRGVVQSIRSNEKPTDIIIYYSPIFYEGRKDYSLTRYYNGQLPLYHIHNSPQADEWGSLETEQELNNLSPIKSRLWLVCWKLCEQKKDMKSIQETIVGTKFQVEKKWFSKSPVTQPLEAYLITPDD